LSNLSSGWGKKEISAPLLPSPPPSHFFTSVIFHCLPKEHQDTNWEFHDDITGETIGVTTPQDKPPRNQGTHESEEASQESSTNTSAGISKRGRICTMSRKMADSVSQHEFYGNAQMHYIMASQAIMGETPEDIFHDLHLELQERMRNPIS
jgi:hypothetical protein